MTLSYTINSCNFFRNYPSLLIKSFFFLFYVYDQQHSNWGEKFPSPIFGYLP